MTAAQLICVIGAESTGKTSLSQSLAAHFDCAWVPEYLREFCDRQERTPMQHEQSLILEAQHAAELAAQAKANHQGAALVFCDAGPLLTAIYSDFIFGDQSLYSRARALHAGYALTLLLEPDIAWVADGLQREGEHVRAPITQMIARELAAMGAPRAVIAGCGESRIASAIDAVKTIKLGRSPVCIR